MQLFLEADALVFKVVRRLRILGQAGLFRLFTQGLQLGVPRVGQLLLAGKDIHRQLLEIIQIPVVHLIQNFDVLHQLQLMVFQLARDLIHILLRDGVFRLRLLNGFICLGEPARDALLLRLVERFQLHEQSGHHVADLPHVAGLHLGERRLGKVRDVLLRGGAVLQDLIGICQVDLTRERRHGLLLLRGEHGQVRAGLGRGLGLLQQIRFLRGRLCRVEIGGQRQCWDLMFFHISLSLLKIIRTGQTFAGHHLLHHANLCRDVYHIVFKQAVKLLLERGDHLFQHVFDLRHALVDVADAHALILQDDILLEQLDRRRQIVVQKLPDLPDILRMLLDIVENFLRQNFQLLQLRRDLEIRDCVVQLLNPPH